jgi:hypothetical protein
MQTSENGPAPDTEEPTPDAERIRAATARIMGTIQAVGDQFDEWYEANHGPVPHRPDSSPSAPDDARLN